MFKLNYDCHCLLFQKLEEFDLWILSHSCREIREIARTYRAGKPKIPLRKVAGQMAAHRSIALLDYFVVADRKFTRKHGVTKEVVAAGWIAGMEYLDQCPFHQFHHAYAQAGKNDQLEAAKWLIDNRGDASDEKAIIRTLYVTGGQKIFAWLEEDYNGYDEVEARDSKFDARFWSICLREGIPTCDLERLKIFEERGGSCDFDSVMTAIRLGRAEIVCWILSWLELDEKEFYNVILASVHFKNWDVAKVVCTAFNLTMKNLVCLNSPELVKWYVERGDPITKGVIRAAAKKGSAEILRILLGGNGADRMNLDEIFAGRPEAVMWLQSQGFAVSPEAVEAAQAACSGSVTCVLLDENGEIVGEEKFSGDIFAKILDDEDQTEQKP
jgi:hypothetical protein